MLSLITALLNAAVRNVRRLRFYVDLKKVSVYVLLMCAALFLCSCSKRADEPVLEPVRIEEDGAAGASAPQSLLTDKKTDAKRATQESVPAVKDEDTVEGNTVSGRNEGKDVSAVSGEADPDAETGQNLLTVHVCGAGKKEGVYSLPAGSRIFDAVKAAGGFSDNADRSYLNLAMEVEDAWQIRIPSKEETEALRRQREVPEQDGSTGSAEDGKDIYGKLTGPDTSFIVKGAAPADGQETGRQAGDTTVETASGQESIPEGSKINLNTASKEELMKIPGVGEKKAQRIIDYREQNGRFESIEDLMKVPGIKNASFQKMREYITVRRLNYTETTLVNEGDKLYGSESTGRG
jgi:competence protein ComEA